MTKRSSPPVPPSAPADLVAVAVGSREVILAWAEYGTVGLGFHIERAVCNSPCSAFAEIGEVGARVLVFRDGSVVPRSSYSYRVHAWNASGHSPPSNVAEVTTPPAGMGSTADGE
jgi:hypothetical protein